ncbi:MAG: hypothetical protein JOZ80_19545 [Acidobacteriaceae bacterium]|nr:hypothetical protein [Acidobacteriaceae bacterium]
MRMAMSLVVILAAILMWAQSNQNPPTNQPSNNSNNNGAVTVRGCVTMENGDYVLTKQDPGNTYQLQKADHVKLRDYLGQRVEISGTKSTTMPTSEDEINARAGSASPVSISVKSIKTISKECRSEQ